MLHEIDTTTPVPTSWRKTTTEHMRYWFSLFDRMPENSSIKITKKEAAHIRVYFARWRHSSEDNKKYVIRMKTPDDDPKSLRAWKVLETNG